MQWLQKAIRWQERAEVAERLEQEMLNQGRSDVADEAAEGAQRMRQCADECIKKSLDIISWRQTREKD